MTSVKKQVERATLELLRSGHDAFYGHFLLRMRRHYTDKVQTAGVSVKAGTINLYINPAFFNSLSEVARAELLKHECDHLTHLHLTRVGERNPQRWNVAADAVVNQGLSTITKEVPGSITPKRLKLPGGLTADDYYERLPQDTQGATLDDHSVWEESDSSTNATLQAEMQKAVRQAGNAPAHVLTTLDKLAEGLINWKQQLRNFIGNSVDVIFDSTRTKRNRRYGLLYPGKRFEAKLNLVTILDLSGSVADDEIAQFFAELDRIYKQGHAIKIVEADADVGAVYDYTGALPNRELSCLGGTNYTPGIVEALKHTPDAIIYFGDMEAHTPEVKPNVPFLWAGVGESLPPADWGRYIKVK